MTTRWLVCVPGIVAACAATEPTGGEVELLPDAATPMDGGADALPSDDDASVCDACEYFPEACTPDVLCSSGLFDPAPSGAGLDVRMTIGSIRGRSRTDVWATGSDGTLAHFDGTSWTRVNLGIHETTMGLWLRGSSEVALVGFDSFYARGVDLPDGGVGEIDGGWSLHAPSYVAGQAPRAGNIVSGVWAAPDAEWLWCSAWRAGGFWRIHQSPPKPFEGQWGVSPEGCRTPTGCSNPGADAQISSIHGWSANDLWAVGLSGVTVRISEAQGASPTTTVYNSQTLNGLAGVWAASATEAWSVGGAGTIRHYTGDPLLWEIVPDVPTAVNLNAVWGSSPTDIWAVGDDSVVLHFDGTSWSRVKIGGLGRRRPSLKTVWVAAPGHVWIGGSGVLLSLGGRP